ncbi:hypothetical protein [Nocardia brasiliensis]|uniref:hypothetical protein n=1 Tax=Nocardia brasiliensis TaxID=37326 RepID=UPI00366EE921
MLILDDITRLKMHHADDQDTLDLMRAFMSMHTTLVLIGVDIPRSGLLPEGHLDRRTSQWVFHSPTADLGDHAATQTERRFDLLHLEPFRYDTPESIAGWVAHLSGLQQGLRLFAAGPDMLTGATMPEYLFRRTRGVVGLLERLIQDDCTEAIATGEEQLTPDLLDTVTIDIGNDPARVADAGEIPTVPDPKSPPSPPERSGQVANRKRSRRWPVTGLRPDSVRAPQYGRTCLQ